MKEHALPTYAELSRTLEKTALKLHASQVHGLICGLICGNPGNASAWEELVTGGKENEKTHEILQALYDASATQLKDFLFELELVLPSDTDALPERAEALTLWCQGVLTGFKISGVAIIDREPSEMTEAINDLIEIAKMNYEEVIATEEDEEAYSELVEFVRMAVILVYQDLREAEAPQQAGNSSKHLH